MPSALQSLRYFWESLPQLPVIAAGSVLEFLLKDEKYSVPVGRVEYLYMHPMTFTEFLECQAPNDLVQTYKQFSLEQPELSYSHHETLLRYFKTYLFVGGMPEAVATYLGRGPKSVRRIHHQLLQSYRDDLQKYPTSQGIREVLREVFDKLPGTIGKKVKYANLVRESSARDVKKAIGLMVDAGILIEVLHTGAAGTPLATTQDSSVRKLFNLDIGLLNAQMGMTQSQIENFGDEFILNQGQLGEQFVAQELFYEAFGDSKTPLHYWLRDKQANNAEVDFVVSKGFEIVPLEVKTGSTGRMRSLKELCMHNKGITRAIRFDLNMASSTKLDCGDSSVTLHSLPIYFSGRTRSLLFGSQE